MNSDDLVQKLYDKITERSGSVIRRLAISVEDDKIFIDGECRRYFHKQVAQSAVKDCVRDEYLICNRIRVLHT